MTKVTVWSIGISSIVLRNGPQLIATRYYRWRWLARLDAFLMNTSPNIIACTYAEVE